MTLWGRVLHLPFGTGSGCHPRHSNIIGLGCSLGIAVFNNFPGNSSVKPRWSSRAVEGILISSIPLMPWGGKDPVLPDVFFFFFFKKEAGSLSYTVTFPNSKLSRTFLKQYIDSWEFMLDWYFATSVFRIKLETSVLSDWLLFRLDQWFSKYGKQANKVSITC